MGFYYVLRAEKVQYAFNLLTLPEKLMFAWEQLTLFKIMETFFVAWFT